MSRRGLRDLLIGLLLTGAAFLATPSQGNQSTASANDARGEPPLQLFCPLH